MRTILFWLQLIFWSAGLGFANSHSVPADATAPPRVETGRVVMVKHREAFPAFTPNAGAIQQMVEAGLIQLSGKSSSAEFWRGALSTQDIVGLKVWASPGEIAGTRPAVAEAVVKTMLAAGVDASRIIIWDRKLSHLYQAGFGEVAKRLQIRLAGATEKGYDADRSYEMALIGKLVYTDLEFDRKGDGIGRKSFVSRLLTGEITKIINITPLLNHNLAGVTGNLYGLAMGSVDNTLRFEVHPENLAMGVAEIYALPELSDRVMLNIVDGLLCQYQGEEKALLHYSVILNELRFSFDPVALDVLSIRELEYQRERADVAAIKPNWVIYENANLLELGENNDARIKIESIDLNKQ